MSDVYKMDPATDVLVRAFDLKDGMVVENEVYQHGFREVTGLKGYYYHASSCPPQVSFIGRFDDGRQEGWSGAEHNCFIVRRASLPEGHKDRIPAPVPGRANITGFGDTEKEAVDDVLRRGADMFGCPVKAEEYDGTAPNWYFGFVRNSSYMNESKKKIYVTKYVRPVA